MQGYGYLTMEEQTFTSTGYVECTGPNTYKVPGVKDIPVEFNVSLLKGSKAKKAVYSSKGIGEPPILLSNSVYLAIKDAIYARRCDAGVKGHFQLDAPATVEKIRFACGPINQKAYQQSKQNIEIAFKTGS